MIKPYACLLLALLAGCAATDGGGLREADLRQSQYFRDERSIPLMFPQLQMALFKHEDACGHAPRFRMDKREVNFATLIDLPEGSSDLRDAIMIDITQYTPGYLHEGRSKAVIYSYRSDAETLQRINHVFDSINKPAECP